jgi:hydrogenase maturation protease
VERIAVIGIGQRLRGDDGAGLEAVRLWMTRFPGTAARPEVRAEVSELPGLNLIELLRDREAAVLVDAVHDASAFPGTLVRAGPEDLAAFAPGSGSAHGWGVAESLQLGQLLEPALAACRLVLVGIVGRDFAPGAGLSPEVRAALAPAAEQIEAELQSLL